MDKDLLQFEQQFFNRLHDKAGICGHCGKKTCIGKKKHSELPQTLTTVDVIEAFKEAKDECVEKEGIE